MTETETDDEWIHERKPEICELLSHRVDTFIITKLIVIMREVNKLRNACRHQEVSAERKPRQIST